ncbi:putative RNA-directed DNA polymerase, eukaryota, reverse transcriptase zinc-binding domain protein, partial [Tanacetum coccineum]
ISLPNVGENFSLLQYADDALFFGAWLESNAKNLIRILKCFQDLSGLSINLSKNRLFGVCVNEPEVVIVANVVRCRHDNLPFMYLGLPVGKDMSKAASWDLVIERFYRRLSSWKSKALSIGGRLTLTKSVLSSLLIYYLSLFRAPLKIIDLLEKIRRGFFWGFKEDERGMSWFNWKTVLSPFNKGGLGIGSIRAKNLAFLGGFCPQLGGLLLGGVLVMISTRCIPLPIHALSIPGSQTIGNGLLVREKILR